MLRWVRLLTMTRRDDRSGLQVTDPGSRRSKMPNLRVISPRTLFRLRTPLSSVVFRQQSDPWLGIQVLDCGRVQRRHASASSSTNPVTASAPSQPPPKSWVELTPKKIRPYLYLARVDKPIGTLLLYYPCSASSPSPEIGRSEL